MINFPRRILRYPILAKRLLSIILILSIVLWVYLIFNPQFFRDIFSDLSENWCENFALKDNLSCGEESLFPEYKSLSSDFKSAVYSFQKGNFKDAINFFEKARKKDQNNPETLIYLNNAKLMQEKGRKSYTIAVVVPINQDSRGTGIAEALLRGAAQVQEDFNKEIKHPGLKIIIANDANDPQKVNNLAKYLLSKEDIVAVIGHYASEVAKEALPVYQQEQVIIMSSATAAREHILSGRKFSPNFLFRTAPSVKFQVPILINKLKLFQLANAEKVAIFYTPSSTFSKSAFEEFRNQLGINKIIEKDVSISGFIPDSTLNEVKQQGAKALILIPDGRVSPKSFTNTLSLIDVNADQLPMAGQLVLYDEQILNKKNIVKNLSIVIPWHPLNSPNQEVVSTAKRIWGTSNINAQSGIFYDATLVLAKALEKVSINDSLKKQRLDIRQQLTNLQVLEGASGQISFDQDGDRKENTSQLVRVVPNKCSTYGAMFVPIDYDTSRLNCP
ncbi:MAG: ABC transporter substrate-binding protein [Aphanizomenon gracile PMC649.10]|nr:ABC transporter substrate-binding protein [Aphanizomenon gracile PMC649.10]